MDGEITAAERQALDAHMSGCETCRAEGGETARLHRALGALREAPAVPAGLEQATLRRVRAVLAAETEDAGTGPRRSGWWMATPLAAALAGIVVWQALPIGGAPPPHEGAAVQPAPVPGRVAAAGARARTAPPAPRTPAAAAAGVQDDDAPPPPQVAVALDHFLEMPILENMEKLQNFDSIRTVDVGEGGRTAGGRG
jgi:anti-sigma factor RsiW